MSKNYEAEIMAQNTDLQHDLLYDIARGAQEKAVRLRRRKMARVARAPGQRGPDDGQRNPTSGWYPGKSFSQRRGMHGEEQAAHYLCNQGLTLLARNIHCRAGEIDVIATDGMALIFVEVRLRESPQYGGAAASVNRAKQRRLIRAAEFFLPQLRMRYFAGKLPPCRFDVISIDGRHLHWIQHAFDHTV